MKQDIRFKGLNLALDEQVVENGALAVCDGMEMCGGALRPCVIEGVRQTAKINGEILYIHEMTNGRKNAIFAVDNDEGLVIGGVTYPKNSLIYQDLSSTEPKPLMAEDNLTRSIINSVTSNGNTLVMLTVNGMKYFRWYNNTYKYLGDMPELEMEFSLREGDIHADFDEGSEDAGYWLNANSLMLHQSKYDVDLSVDYTKSENLLVREEAMDAALGKAKQLCHKKNYFALPFFIRYCYKLWDGRKVMHSAPVLLFSDISHPEAVIVGRSYYSNETNYHWNWALLLPQKLHVKVWNSEVIHTIKTDWVDIIKSIDIYITPEISRRDESVKVEIPESGIYPWSGRWEILYHHAEHVTDVFSTTLVGLSLTQQSFNVKYQYAIALKDQTDRTQQGWLAKQYFYFHAQGEASEYKNTYGIFHPKEIGDEQWKKRLLEQNAYYLLKRYDLREAEEPKDGYLPIDDGIIENIEAQEQMITSTAPDDYRTHNSIIARQSYIYNNRINLTDIQEIPFKGFPMYCMTPHAVRSDGHMDVKAIVVRLEENGKNIYVQETSDTLYSYDRWYLQNTFLFYPDTRAKEIWIYDSLTNWKRYNLVAHFSLNEHPFLNGVYHIGNLCSLVASEISYTDGDCIEPSIITDNPRFDLRNYIFTSASGNPFVFPAAHRYSVGLGSVLAIASTTRALSQGQFGQYPLIAFATDGIYALEISSTGSYSGIQPISREVITNPRSLLQLDQSIAFVTRRAVNQLVSSDVTSLSDMLNGALRDLSEMLKGREGETVIPSTGQVADLIGAMQDAQGIYDFVNSRLLYFLKDGDTFTGDVLVFCANDGAWAYKSLGDDIIKGIYNSYPYPYIHKTDGSIECLSVPYDNMEEGSYSGVVVTRTLKTEGVRNAIREFFQDYDFGADTDRPTLILWGSNDNRTWRYIGRSNARQMGRLPGRIYRYFRLAVKFENMKRNDLYHGVQLDIVERFTR